MFFAIILFISELLFGLLVFDFFDSKKKFQIIEKIISAGLAGFLISNFLILLLAIVFGSLYHAIILFILIFVITCCFYYKNIINDFFELKIYLRKVKWQKLLLLKNFWVIPFFIFFCLYCFYVFLLLHLGPDGNMLSLYGGDWADNGFHISLIQWFSNSQPFSLDHPLLSGSKLTYHFIMDFSSAVLYKVSGKMIISYNLPIFLASLSAFFLIFFIAYRILKSKSFAALSLLLIFMGSGLGFLAMAKDYKAIYKSGGITSVVKELKDVNKCYTHFSDKKDPNEKIAFNISWITPIASFFHQRSSIFGIAVFSLILLSIFCYGNSANFWKFGIFAGLLPLSQAHSFVSIFILMAVLFWFFIKNFKAWIKFAILAIVVSLPQILYLKTANTYVGSFFLKPWFGWTMCDHTNSWFFCQLSANRDTNAFFFWFKNFGFIFIAWVAALVLFGLMYAMKKNNQRQNLSQNMLLLASIFLFLIPNLVLFQPWDFDNNKILFYWWFIAIIAGVCPLLMMIRKKFGFLGKIFIIFFVFFSVLAGFYDLLPRLFFNKNFSYGYADSSPKNIVIASWIKENTPPNSVFLSNPWVDSIPVFLAGRKLYLGYQGWLWSEGLDYSKNESNAKKVLQGNYDLACKEKIDYILLDNWLKNSFPFLSEDKLLKGAKIIFSQETPDGSQKILKIECP